MGHCENNLKTQTTHRQKTAKPWKPKPHKGPELERETGIEPASLAWKARVLPLNYSRSSALYLTDLPLTRTNSQTSCEPLTTFIKGKTEEKTTAHPEIWWMGLDSNQRTR